MPTTGSRWRYDARLMATNPHLVPVFLEPAYRAEGGDR